nr:ATP-dependent RNA helicase p62-like [Rhipicephalus microplus]
MASKAFLCLKPKAEASKEITYGLAYAPVARTQHGSPKGKLHGGDDVLKPILALEESNFPDFIVRGIKAQGEHTSPTCIEAHCWSIALSGGNFLAKAETGSHKALAYVLPAVIHVRQQSPLEERGGPIVVVLAPTPKLAKQVHNVA